MERLLADCDYIRGAVPVMQVGKEETDFIGAPMPVFRGSCSCSAGSSSRSARTSKTSGVGTQDVNQPVDKIRVLGDGLVYCIHGVVGVLRSSAASAVRGADVGGVAMRAVGSCCGAGEVQ